MDNNTRVILAVGLSLLILLVWNFIFPPPKSKPVVSQNKTQKVKTSQSQPKPQPVKSNFTPVGEFNPQAGKKIIVETPLYKAVLNSQGGILEHFILKKYKVSVKPNSPNIDLISPDALTKGPLGIIWNKIPSWLKFNWSYQGQDLHLTQNETKKLVFKGEYNGITLLRELQFNANTYQIKEHLKILTTQPITNAEIAFVISTLPLTRDENRYNPTRIVYLGQSGLEEEHDKDDLSKGIITSNQVKWGAIANNYFLLGLIPTSKNFVFKAKLEEKIYRLALAQNLEGSFPKEVSCIYYLGPKEKKQLSLVPNHLESAIHYGWFDFIAKPLIEVLNFFYKYTHNYGIAIILLTILIKLLFWPLSNKSYKSMNQMKKLQPLMAEIREKYKDDRQKMNEEMMRLYKTYKVNPAGGCMPMLIQIPVFFGLYQGLLGAIELRHAAFISHLPFTNLIWLADLSAKDPYYITPLIMGATMFIQQKMTPAPGDPTQAKMMLFMPIIFTFLFLNFPSGLVIYWLVNNILSIAQQWWMMKKQA
ncbi:membrane protein insertase YidC [Desulfonauticus submarinus]|nr:membrane protein insertase YidC [Desulfonauticus submarinus]